MIAALILAAALLGGQDPMAAGLVVEVYATRHDLAVVTARQAHLTADYRRARVAVLRDLAATRTAAPRDLRAAEYEAGHAALEAEAADLVAREAAIRLALARVLRDAGVEVPLPDGRLRD